jgi:hypothetical protein
LTSVIHSTELCGWSESIGSPRTGERTRTNSILLAGWTAPHIRERPSVPTQTCESIPRHLSVVIDPLRRLTFLGGPHICLGYGFIYIIPVPKLNLASQVAFCVSIPIDSPVFVWLRANRILEMQVFFCELVAKFSFAEAENESIQPRVMTGLLPIASNGKRALPLSITRIL